METSIWYSNNDSDIGVEETGTGDNIITSSSLRLDGPSCPSCGHPVELYGQGRMQELPGLPAGVKFDPTDMEILEHLKAKVNGDDDDNNDVKLHPLIDEFITTLEGGICSTHPDKLPGVRRDGHVRHFFHRPSKAYTTGTRKRRKIHMAMAAVEGETRWHKTGKTRPILEDGKAKGFKKILVLYTNYGRRRKPEKTNWIMHQYHLGRDEEEKDGELVVSKVFYQTQPRQCGQTRNDEKDVSRSQMDQTQNFQYGIYGSITNDRSTGKLQLIPKPIVQWGNESISAQYLSVDPTLSASE